MRWPSREFVPVILRVNSATREEPSRWQVETDRGPTSFQVNSEGDVRRIEPAHASVVDSHGIRYWIPDIRRLDSRRRRQLLEFPVSANDGHRKIGQDYLTGGNQLPEKKGSRKTSKAAFTPRV